MKLLKLQYATLVVIFACLSINYIMLPLSYFPEYHYKYYAFTYDYIPFVDIIGWLAFLLSSGLILYNRKKINPQEKAQIKWKASVVVTSFLGVLFIINVILLVTDL